jgi:hypothetical protein
MRKKPRQDPGFFNKAKCMGLAFFIFFNLSLFLKKIINLKYYKYINLLNL